jgi:site-specific DNA-cytosine methylase
MGAKTGLYLMGATIDKPGGMESIQCINSAAGMGGGQAPVLTQGARIRKLTPKECFRLQGFPDEYFERAAAVNSNSQLYKQAGNSVTVNVIYAIAKRLKL